MTRLEQVVDWIRSELEAHGKSQLELARFLGLQESQVSKLMRGKRGLDVNELERVEQFFGQFADVHTKQRF